MKTTHVNSDMIVLRKNPDAPTILVEDRFSYAHDRPPILDTDNLGSKDVYHCDGKFIILIVLKMILIF